MRRKFFSMMPQARAVSGHEAGLLQSVLAGETRPLANPAPQAQLQLPAFTLHTVLILSPRATGDLWRTWIEAEPDLYVIGDASSNFASLAHRVHQPDVVLYQTGGSPTQPDAVLNHLPHVFPETRLLLIASDEKSFYEPFSPLEQARGVIYGPASRDTLVRAIRIVVTGGTYFLPPTRS